MSRNFHGVVGTLLRVSTGFQVPPRLWLSCLNFGASKRNCIYFGAHTACALGSFESDAHLIARYLRMSGDIMLIPWSQTRSISSAVTTRFCCPSVLFLLRKKKIMPRSSLEPATHHPTREVIFSLFQTPTWELDMTITSCAK